MPSVLCIASIIRMFYLDLHANLRRVLIFTEPVVKCTCILEFVGGTLNGKCLQRTVCVFREKERETETKTETQRQRQRDRDKDRDRERETERQRKTETERERDREREGERECFVVM